MNDFLFKNFTISKFFKRRKLFSGGVSGILETMHHLEIERKFLVHESSLPPLGSGMKILQSYLFWDAGKEVRIRILKDRAHLDIKIVLSPQTREEYAYDIPIDEALKLMETGSPFQPLRKTRYLIPAGALTWEIDVFHQQNEGLVVAEVELPREDFTLERPVWLGEEVTHLSCYYNVHLFQKPYSTW